jgi:predicted SAM-dependent methyltransferase
MPIARIIDRCLHTWLGQKFVGFIIRTTQYRVFSPWTVRLMELDSLRLAARRCAPRALLDSDLSRLHLGCGNKRIPGWLNIDLVGTNPIVDLGCGRLPWKNRVFDVAVSQHVVEHLELESEFVPLLTELKRVLKPGGELWLSCPDLEIVCRSYVACKGRDLLADRLKHATVPTGLERFPFQYFINAIFHQAGEHKNLYDFELLEWALTKAGFIDCERTNPSEFRELFPEFPPAANDMHSIYVRARIAPDESVADKSHESAIARAGA